MEPPPVTDKLKLPQQPPPKQNGSQTTTTTTTTQNHLRALRDTGYETEPDCSNGKIPLYGFGGGGDSPSSEKPFDVDCESHPIEFADADDPCC